MAENVTLKIWTPERTVMNKKVYRVVLPYSDKNLTVLENRAPTSLVINAGVLQILDENEKVKEWYFVDNGVADIADNVCQISTRHFIEHSRITADEALKLRDAEPENAVFYETIHHYLTAFES